MSISEQTIENRLWIILPLMLILYAFNGDKELRDNEPVFKALILDGQNNHYIWPKTTQMMKSYLEQTGLFQVDIARTKQVDLGIKYNPNRPYRLDQYFWEYPADLEENQRLVSSVSTDQNYSPSFSDYDLVVSNLGLNAASWSESTKEAFTDYIKNGGGLVVVHAANNAFGDWNEFNKMIGLGAWGGRDQNSGPYVYYDNSGKLIRDDGPGICGSHGPEHEFLITARAPDHPIMQGLPPKWMHAKDELYDRMRGPAKNMTILATAYSDLQKNDPPWDKNTRGSERNEPMLMVTNYGKGRIFHSALGHFDYSQECVGFITTFQRGAEWAASGRVTQALPKDFPSAKQSRSRSWAPAASVAKAQHLRKQNNPYSRWENLVNEKTRDSLSLYSVQAVSINSLWVSTNGHQQIREQWERFPSKIDSSWTMDYMPANNRGRFAYEIAGFKTDQDQLFGQLIIWELENQGKKRMLEFTSPVALVEVDLSEITSQREKWMQYCNAHQVDKLVNELYTKDALYYNHRPMIKGRERLIQEYSYMGNPAYKLALKPITVRPFSKDLVVEIGQCEGSYPGKYILIWQRSDQGVWQIALDSNI